MVNRQTGEMEDVPRPEIRLALPAQPREWPETLAADTPAAPTLTHGGKRTPRCPDHLEAAVVRRAHCGVCDRVLLEDAESLWPQDAAIETSPTTPGGLIAYQRQTSAIEAPAPIALLQRQDAAIGRRRYKDPPDGWRDCVHCGRRQSADICAKCECIFGQSSAPVPVPRCRRCSAPSMRAGLCKAHPADAIVLGRVAP